MVVKMLNKLLFSALVSFIMVNSVSFAQGTTDEFLEGGAGRISSSHVKQMLESPDKKLTEGGRTFKLVNPHISKGLLDEMAKSNETISGTWSSGSEIMSGVFPILNLVLTMTEESLSGRLTLVMLEKTLILQL